MKFSTFYLFLHAIHLVSGFIPFNNFIHMSKKYPLSKPLQKRENTPKDPLLSQNSQNPNKTKTNYYDPEKKKYHIFKPKTVYEKRIKNLNSKNYSIYDQEILGYGYYIDAANEGKEEARSDYEDNLSFLEGLLNSTTVSNAMNSNGGGLRIVINRNMFSNDDEEEDADIFGRRNAKNRDKKSENFEVTTKHPLTFQDIGGFEKIKLELYQCVDFLSNYTKYSKYNVRLPKGLILEGPPGNGKTMLAKAFAGESKIGFIAVSGSEFQEKYVGVGSSRVRELFQLAKKNIPCIIFIDEIDAIGRKRSGDGESSSNERDNTLNELLVALDGFKNNTGIFLIGATNRIDLLDPALIRPGRIDKRIYIGLPDASTREAILNIHIKGKPHDHSIVLKDMVDLTMGLSGAQIENLLNEAMLNALRYDRTEFNIDDIDIILNKMLAGWQPTDHQFTADLINQIAIHEMGHAVIGLIAKHHSKMTKVIINLSSPQSPAYTVFESSTTSIYTREALFEHLAILLAGRIAEEIFYDVSITTGAINDFEEALKLAEKMIVYYGMGKNVIYPSFSDKYKEMIDNEVVDLINDANAYSTFILKNCKELMLEGAELLKRDKLLKAETLISIIENKYQHIFDLKYEHD